MVQIYHLIAAINLGRKYARTKTVFFLCDIV